MFNQFQSFQAPQIVQPGFQMAPAPVQVQPPQPTLLVFSDVHHRENGFLCLEFPCIPVMVGPTSGRKYYTPHQYISALKARLFNAWEIQGKILELAIANPIAANGDFNWPEIDRLNSTVTALVQQIPNFDPLAWSTQVAQALRQTIYMRFCQSDVALQLLLNTGDAFLVYVNPDRELGIGYTMETAASSKPEQWGQNLLGHLLMEVRRELRKTGKAAHTWAWVLSETPTGVGSSTRNDIAAVNPPVQPVPTPTVVVADPVVQPVPEPAKIEEPVPVEAAPVPNVVVSIPADVAATVEVHVEPQAVPVPVAAPTPDAPKAEPVAADANTEVDLLAMFETAPGETTAE